MRKAIIFGAGTYGQVYARYLSSDYDIIGYIDDDATLSGKSIDGLEVLGGKDFLLRNVSKETAVFVPIGNNAVRAGLLREFNDSGFETPSFIHPATNIHDSVQTGRAVYILPGTNIMPCTVLNDYVMVSMGVNIAHHNTIGQACFFSQGTNIGASTDIGEKAYFGIGSTLMTGVKNVGRNCLVGAGSVVIRDVPDNAVVAGVPARILKYNLSSE